VATYKEKVYTLKNGETTTVKEIRAMTGIGPKAVYARIHKGRSREHAFRPVRGCGSPFEGKNNSFNDTYRDMPEELFKLMFGAWDKSL